MRILPARQESKGLVRLPDDSGLQATWWAQRPGGNSYWRCEIPARVLPGQVLQLSYSDLEMTERGIAMPRQKGEAAIWSYVANATRGTLLIAQIDAGYRGLIEVDDNYLIQPNQIPEGATDWQVEFDTTLNDRHSVKAHRKLAGAASGIIVTTEYLAEAYRQVNDNVYVCPNSIDPEDWPEPHKPTDGIFRIGYAASHSHWYDASDVRRALAWAAYEPDVQVVLYGLDPKWEFDYLHIPWTKDLAVYRKSLQLLDVGVCPLRPSAWSNCKSDIKAMEYCMVGAAPIVSATVPYQNWEGLALVAHTPKEFLKHVRWLCDNRDAAKELAATGKAYALAERTIARNIGAWRKAIAW